MTVDIPFKHFNPETCRKEKGHFQIEPGNEQKKITRIKMTPGVNLRLSLVFQLKPADFEDHKRTGNYS